MKKKLYSNICLWCLVAITLCACGKQGNPIMLPDREEIISIGVFDGENVGYSPNAEGRAGEFIDEFLSILMDMEVTNKESITDAPVNVEYIEISLNCDDKNTTLFYYKDKGTEYVEQPYQGIYKPAPALGLYITEMFNSTDNNPASVVFQATVIETNNDTMIEQAEADAMWDRMPMVRVNDKLYYDTGRESAVADRCGNMDGQITSEVDGSEIPTENDQSNFGTGFGYQYGENDTIEIYISEKWYVFEYRGEKEASIIKTYEVTDSDTAFANDELVTMVKYYEMSDCTWKTDTHTYQYRLEITGRMGGAEKDSTFVFLSNIENITFEQAWKAAGFSSLMSDYFEEEDAKLVALK